MSGEFFLRYDNLEHDDATQGNDYNTRVASATLFLLGLAIQAYVMVSVCISVASFQNSSRSSHGGRGSSGRQIEMMNVSNNVVVSFTLNPLTSSSIPSQKDEVEI